MTNIKLEVLDRAKKCLKNVDFTKETNYIVRSSYDEDAGEKVKNILPNIYIMGFNDAINDIENNGGINGSSKK
jgi:hypothetical protein